MLNLIIPVCFCVASETPVLPHAEDRFGKSDDVSIHFLYVVITAFLTLCIICMLNAGDLLARFI